MPRLSFSLRDVFWLTLVVAMGVGWWVHLRRVGDAASKLQLWATTLERAMTNEGWVFHSPENDAKATKAVRESDGVVEKTMIRLTPTGYKIVVEGAEVEPVGQP